MKFGEKLKQLMKERGMKAVTLAQRMGISSSYISQLIVGRRKPGRETLLKLSKALEVPIETLLMTEADISDGIPISRKIPVLDETQLEVWTDSMDLHHPSRGATIFENATTADPNAFYITGLSCCGMKECDLMLIEPNKEVKSGDIVLVCCPMDAAIKKIIIKDNMVILTDEKQDPMVVLTEEIQKENWKFYKVSQCIKKL